MIQKSKIFLYSIDMDMRNKIFVAVLFYKKKNVNICNVHVLCFISTIYKFQVSQLLYKQGSAASRKSTSYNFKKSAGSQNLTKAWQSLFLNKIKLPKCLNLCFVAAEPCLKLKFTHFFRRYF